MNRDDVIDVLSVVAAASRRSVGETDVDVWSAIIGDLPIDLALRAVRDHLREQPGVWLEPGHVYQRVRTTRRDQLEREPAAMREARQRALEAKAAEDTEDRAASTVSVKYQRPRSNSLLVKCPHCGAGPLEHCVAPGRQRRRRSRPHPSRLSAATTQAGAA